MKMMMTIWKMMTTWKMINAISYTKERGEIPALNI